MDEMVSVQFYIEKRKRDELDRAAKLNSRCRANQARFIIEDWLRLHLGNVPAGKKRKQRAALAS